MCAERATSKYRDSIFKGFKPATTTIFTNIALTAVRQDDFRKDWQRRVRTHFDQPGRKQRRRSARVAKAAAVAPRPVDKLRPVVRCPTVKYNRRVRAGRGFTLTELKEAGIPRPLARTIGIAVDHRRQNLSTESLTENVARLKSYRVRLILFPRKSGQHKKLDSSAEDVKAAKAGEGLARFAKTAMPITNKHTKEAVFSEVKVSEMGKGEEGGAYRRLRVARSDARLVGKREKRAREKDDEATAAKK
ncbi:MAG: 60S ribosomal protein L13 [Caeruleum heppii]|nr:MAG: 60S ribosomal protein L13 [Caeruleum heppii]